MENYKNKQIVTNTCLFLFSYNIDIKNNNKFVATIMLHWPEPTKERVEPTTIGYTSNRDCPLD